MAFSSALNIRQMPCPNNLEVVTVSILLSLFLYLIYHPPNADDKCNLSILSFLTSLDFAKNVAVIGYLNLSEVDWST